MSASNAIGDFDLITIKLRKKIEFPDGTIQDTAYTGDGSETLAEVLAVGNNASGQDIINLNTLSMITAGGVPAQITQNTLVVSQNNVLNPTIITASNIGATPTFQVSDSTNGQSTRFVPNSAGGNYNPINTANCQEIVAWGGAGVNTQTLALVPWSGTSCGLRASGGNGSPVNAYLEVGCGGGGADPSQRIRFDNATNQLQMTYTGLTITTGALPNTSGGSATLFLPVTINGVAYKIPLNLA